MKSHRADAPVGMDWPGGHPARMSIIRNVPFLRQGDVAQNTQMKQKLEYILFVTIIISSIAFNLSAQSNLNFQADLDSHINENIPGVLVTVICKEKQIDWSGASGYADKKNKS